MFPSRYAREIPERYRLEGLKCKKCGEVAFPRRLKCHECGVEEFTTIKLKDTGKIITYTIIRIAPKQFADEAPYAVGIVELDDKTRITTQIVDVDFDKLKTGLRVKVEFRKIQEVGESGILCYGYKCVPLER